MQKKPLIGLTLAAAVIALIFIGCSAITPDPEIRIIEVDPPGGIDPAVGVTVTFENMNHVDALLTKRVITYTDTVGTPVATESYNTSGFINAEGTLEYTFMPTIVPMGSGRSYSVTFTGTDAYGYGKTFTVSTTQIWY